jgi:hypothetical protein
MDGSTKLEPSHPHGRSGHNYWNWRKLGFHSEIRCSALALHHSQHRLACPIRNRKHNNGLIMPVQDFINRVAICAGFTSKLSGLAFKPFAGNSAASGTVDWYTCPAGKRAAVIQITACSPAGSTTVTPQLKSGGVYYNLNTAYTVSAIGTVAGGIQQLIILEAGESISTVQNTTGINVWGSVLEFDSITSFKTVKLLSLSAGANTLYTCPAGKTATFCFSNLSPVIASNGTSTGITYWNNSGGTRTVSVYHVPNGGSAGTSNQLLSSGTASVLTAGFLTGQSIANCMNPGDFLQINTDAATATQTAWVTVWEL